MKKLLFSFVFSLSLLQINAAELSWKTDLSKALTEAKAEKKMVLGDFTGSDW